MAYFTEDQYLESQTMSLDEGAEVSLFDDSLDKDKCDNNVCNEQVNEILNDSLCLDDVEDANLKDTYPNQLSSEPHDTPPNQLSSEPHDTPPNQPLPKSQDTPPNHPSKVLLSTKSVTTPPCSMSIKLTPCFGKKIKSKATSTNATPPLDDISSSTINEVTKIKPKFNSNKKVKISAVVPKGVQPPSLLGDNEIPSSSDKAKTSSEVLRTKLTKVVKKKKQRDSKQMVKKCFESSKKKTIITTINRGKQSERKTSKIRKETSLVNKQTSLLYDVQMRSPPLNVIKESTPPSLPDKESTSPSLSDKESTPLSLAKKENTPPSLTNEKRMSPLLGDKESISLSLDSLSSSLESIPSLLSDKESMPPSLSDKKSLPSSLSNEETNISPSLIDKESMPPSLWVQCDNPGCLKWRKLTDIVDPAHIPDKWYCSMNKDPQYNSCNINEEVWSDPDESHEFVYSPYIPGSIIWAKIEGYPWWPGMIEEDPDEECYYETEMGSSVPSRYHVVFFDTPVSRGWVHVLNTSPFTINSHARECGSEIPGKYKGSLTTAVRQAQEALQISVVERLSLWGFKGRYGNQKKRRRENHLKDDKSIKKRKVKKSQANKENSINN